MKFIRDCLDGFVMQKTNFPFEVIIHDDASTDGTADIIREYAKKYPDIIKPILQTENQWKKGVSIGPVYTWPKVQGEYVAMCEGDDYWTDPYKLQKQVDFLDAHPDYSVCFHPVRVVWDDKRMPDYFFPTKEHRFNKTELELSDLLKRNFIQTNSVVYRWRKECVDIFPWGILPGDWYMHLLHAQVGKIGFLPDVMAVYRRNAGGVWTGALQDDKWFLQCTLPHLKFFVCAEKQFNHDYHKNMVDLTSFAVADFLRNRHFEELHQIQNLYPQIYNEVLSRLVNQPQIETLQKKARKYKRLFNITLAVTGVFFVMGILIKIIF